MGQSEVADPGQQRIAAALGRQIGPLGGQPSEVRGSELGQEASCCLVELGQECECCRAVAALQAPRGRLHDHQQGRQRLAQLLVAGPVHQLPCTVDLLLEVVEVGRLKGVVLAVAEQASQRLMPGERHPQGPDRRVLRLCVVQQEGTRSQIGGRDLERSGDFQQDRDPVDGSRPALDLGEPALGPAQQPGQLHLGEPTATAVVGDQLSDGRCVGWRRGHCSARLDGVGGDACTGPQTQELDTRRSCHVLLALGEKPANVWLLLVSVEGRRGPGTARRRRERQDRPRPRGRRRQAFQAQPRGSR